VGDPPSYVGTCVGTVDGDDVGMALGTGVGRDATYEGDTVGEEDGLNVGIDVG